MINSERCTHLVCRPAHASASHTLFVSLPVRLAQSKLLDLPGCRLGQHLNELHRFRSLEMCHAIATEANQLALLQALAGLEHDESLGHLPPLLIGDADDGGFEHCRMLIEHGFHLDR